MATDGPPGIGDYGLIGDCRSAALVSREGSVDWLCFPDFDSPSLFAALLDPTRGGRFSIRPDRFARCERRYRDESLVLETRFHTERGSAVLCDLLTIPPAEETLAPQRELLRLVQGESGEVDMTLCFDPRPSYARLRVPLRRRGELGWFFGYSGECFVLRADVPVEPADGGRRLIGRFTVREGETVAFSLGYMGHDIAVLEPLGRQALARMEDTLRWWVLWSERCRYGGCFRREVRQNLRVLKALNFCLSGALIAAPTTSLPEHVGGTRNWDYRYCWLRDASMALPAFIDLGYPEEGDAFLHWLLYATRLTWPRLQVLYDVYGRTRLRERTLEHLSGFRDSRPVRIGNGAYRQRQLDIYGSVVLAAYDFAVRGGSLGASRLRLLKGLGDSVCELWREPDNGIWEPRGPRRHYTYSKVMCWVALDRLLRLHDQLGLGMDGDRVRRERDALRRSIETHAYHAGRRSFTSAYGEESVDATLLLLPRLGFIDALDPRMQSTYARIERELGHGALVRRYPHGFDYFSEPEGAFGICGYWAVNYLICAGRLDEAEQRLEALITHGNDLGLHAEEFDLATGAPLGNFPQAFTHTGLINAILDLDHARRGCVRGSAAA